MPQNNLALPRFLAAADAGVLAGVQVGINNNNHNPLWNVREQLFHVLFLRIALAYTRTFSKPVRKIVEHLFLFAAILSFLILIYIHVAFIKSTTSCLDHVAHNWPRDGILRVEILHNDEQCDIENVYLSDVNLKPESNKEEKTLIRDSELLLNSTYPSDENVENDASDKESALIKNKLEELIEDSPHTEINLGSVNEDGIELLNLNMTLQSDRHVHNAAQENCSPSLKIPPSELEMFTKAIWPQDEYVVEYSLEYGFLKLSPSTRQKLNIPIKIVTLDPKKNVCFGNWLSRFLLSEFVGYGDVLMISLKNLVDKDEQKGYVRNVVTGEQYRFVNRSMSCTSYFAAAFIMMVFTLSVSMLLRYSHHQIFLFIVELLHMLEFSVNVTFPAAPLLTVILALVGMEAIMSEFFNDTTTAFYVILIIWVADQYEAVCCHTVITKRHWLRFFYLYHFAFYAYHYRFSGQYSSLALFTSCLFIQHSMVYFFHNYELPAIIRQAHQSPAHNAAPRDYAVENPELPDIDEPLPTDDEARAAPVERPEALDNVSQDSQIVESGPSEESSSLAPGADEVGSLINACGSDT